MKPKDIFAFIVLSFAWGSSFFWIKIGLTEFGPFTLVAYRLLFGILGLLVVVLIQRPEFPKDKKVWKVLAVIGLTNTAIPFFLFSWGELFIDSGLTSILNGTLPLFTTVIAHFALDDDKITKNRAIALTVGFIGIFILISRDLTSGIKSNLLGQGAILLAVIFYAFSAVYTRARTKGVSPTYQALLPLIVADAFIWFPTLAFESPVSLPVAGITWIAVLWLGLIGSCLAYLLYFYLLHSIGPTRTSMVTYTFPVVGVFLGYVFLDEVISTSMLLGGGLVIGSILLMNKK